MTETQTCRDCHQELPLDSFRRIGRGAGGRREGTCIRCVRMKMQSTSEKLEASDEEQTRRRARGMAPTRKCAGLPGRPCQELTFDHRCPKCLRSWRRMHAVGSSQSHSEFDSSL